MLRKFDNLIFTRILKLLKKKYGSTPKLLCFIMDKFYNDGRIIADEVKLLKMSDIRPYGNCFIGRLSLSKQALAVNPYLNWYNFVQVQIKKMALEYVQCIRQGYLVSRRLRSFFLLSQQKGKCSICGGWLEVPFGTSIYLKNHEYHYVPSLRSAYTLW